MRAGQQGGVQMDGLLLASDGLHASGRRMLACMQLLTRPVALHCGAQALPRAAARATMPAWPSTAATTSACTASWQKATSMPPVRAGWWKGRPCRGLCLR